MQGYIQGESGLPADGACKCDGRTAALELVDSFYQFRERKLASWFGCEWDEEARDFGTATVWNEDTADGQICLALKGEIEIIKPEGCCKLYCGNLSYDIDDAALRAFFEPLALSAIRWVTDRETGDFKGCGFAEFASTEDADQAFLKQGQVLMSRPVRLDWAEDKPKKWEQ